MLRQQRVDKTLAVIEARPFEPLEGGGEVHETSARREVEQAQGAVTANPRRRAAATPSRSSMSRRSAFSAMASAIASRSPASSVSKSSAPRPASIGRVSSHGGGAATQARTCFGRFGMREFVAHALRRQDFLKEPGKKLDVARQHEIVERPRIGDDEPHAASKAES
jgi:hypothetical protein